MTIRTVLIAAAMAAIAFTMVPARCIAAEPNVLTVGNPFSPLSMDPARSGNGRAGTHLMPAYEPLVRVRPDGTFEPALAVAWEMSADSMSATFTLRQDARFSDGEPVTADAARQLLRRAWSGSRAPAPPADAWHCVRRQQSRAAGFMESWSRRTVTSARGVPVAQRYE